MKTRQIPSSKIGRRSRVCASRQKSSAPTPPRKAANQTSLCPYRKPTPVGRENPPEVNEKTSVKELGKLTPYLWKKGCLSSVTQWEARAGRRKSAQATV